MTMRSLTAAAFGVRVALPPGLTPATRTSTRTGREDGFLNPNGVIHVVDRVMLPR
jgi:hypothetical protein